MDINDSYIESWYELWSGRDIFLIFLKRDQFIGVFEAYIALFGVKIGIVESSWLPKHVVPKHASA
jgi:hypothetical protein